MDRRQFIEHSSTLAAGAVAASLLPAGDAQAATPAGFKKGVKIGMVQTPGSLADKFKLLKKLGYDGIELDSPNKFKVEEVLAARDEAGLPIHGVVDSVHWGKPLSSPDPEVRAAGLAGLQQAIRDAKAYGATSVLLVPAVVNKEVSYADAYTRSQVEIKKALPLADELGINIAFENVWNNFLLSPLETARYIDEFDNKRVGAYFDVGNIVTYGWPEQWISILGKRIMKLDIKEFSRKKRDAEGYRNGFNVELLEGDCDWKAVMNALREIGFVGWGTAEIRGGDEQRLADIAALMDKIFAL